MDITIRKYTTTDIEQMITIWNEIVHDGVAFPQVEPLTISTANDFFAEQSFTGVAESAGTKEVLGLYILHPNNIGRCGHISNSSYAVLSTARGQNIGEKLVIHSIEKSRELGFRILQFNAVVRTNFSAISLYEKLGFVKLGTIPGGFWMKDGRFEDIVPFYRTL